MISTKIKLITVFWLLIFNWVNSQNLQLITKLKAEYEQTDWQPQLNSSFKKLEFKCYRHFNSPLNGVFLTDLAKADTQTAQQLITYIQQDPRVAYCELAPVYRTCGRPNDYQTRYQWGPLAIGADRAWDYGRASSDIKIAIVDNAINTKHPDLRAAIWINKGEIPNNGIDDDNNGYVDDYQGYDVADEDGDVNPPIATFEWSHGSHCAGLAAAVADNGIGLATIGSGASIIPVKCTSDTDHPASIGYAYLGVEYAIAAGADIISMSFSTIYYSQYMKDLAVEAHNKGIVLVAAASNNGDSQVYYPGFYAEVIAVGATDRHDVKAVFSNYGTNLDVLAPGVGSYSCLANNSYGYMSGTSMSTPLVAGVVAWLESQKRNLQPEDVRTLLHRSSINIDASNPNVIGYLGHGRLDLNLLVDNIDYFEPTCPIAEPVKAQVLSTQTVKITWPPAGFSRRMYVVYHPVNQSNNIQRSSTNTKGEITLTSLQANTVYKYYLERTCAYNTPSPPDRVERYFITRPEYDICLPLRGLRYSKLTPRYINLRWDKNLNAQVYRIRLVDLTTNQEQLLTTSLTEGSFFNLLPQRSYKLYHQTTCKNGITTPYNPQFEFTTPPEEGYVEPDPVPDPDEPVEKNPILCDYDASEFVMDPKWGLVKNIAWGRPAYGKVCVAQGKARFKLVNAENNFRISFLLSELPTNFIFDVKTYEEGDTTGSANGMIAAIYTIGTHDKRFVYNNPLPPGVYIITVFSNNNSYSDQEFKMSVEADYRSSNLNPNYNNWQPRIINQHLNIPFEAELYDIQGRKIKTLIMGDNDLSYTPRGIYLIKTKNRYWKISI